VDGRRDRPQELAPLVDGRVDELSSVHPSVHAFVHTKLLFAMGFLPNGRKNVVFLMCVRVRARLFCVHPSIGWPRRGRNPHAANQEFLVQLHYPRPTSLGLAVAVRAHAVLLAKAGEGPVRDRGQAPRADLAEQVRADGNTNIAIRIKARPNAVAANA
jgi:hypothetical protein